MWKIYVILALWTPQSLNTQSLNTQQSVYITNSRGDNGKNSFKTSADQHSEYDYGATQLTSRNNNNNNNTIAFSQQQLPSRSIHNTNSRDSFANVYGLGETHLYSETTKEKHSEYDYSATQLTSRNNNNNNTIAYNTNSRDSFANAYGLYSQTTKEIKQNANTNNGNNNLSTKSPPVALDTSSINIQSSTIRKIPTGNSFNSKLFDIISSMRRHENMVYSPISLQTLLAFIFTISDGKLYEELAQLLDISSNRLHVAKTFENILQTASLNTPTTALIFANKLYYDYRFGLPSDHGIGNFAKKSFASEVEQIDFFASQKAAGIINSWVSEITRNRIQDIVTATSISGDTRALLLNSLYFKSEWLKKFATYDTETQEFFVNRQERVHVNMMYNEDVFRYGEFNEDLQASVVELPYATVSNLSMLLLLPKDVEGLAALESKLKYYDLESIAQRLKREIVIVKLPRFKVEFEIDMIKPLQDLGLNALFNNVGSINLFKNQQTPLQVDQFKHKSFINVNEAGTEAAATTVAKYIPLSLPSDMKYFVADHPFVFVIRSPNITFFIGHVVRL